MRRFASTCYAVNKVGGSYVSSQACQDPQSWIVRQPSQSKVAIARAAMVATSLTAPRIRQLGRLVDLDVALEFSNNRRSNKRTDPLQKELASSPLPLFPPATISVPGHIWTENGVPTVNKLVLLLGGHYQHAVTSYFVCPTKHVGRIDRAIRQNPFSHHHVPWSQRQFEPFPAFEYRCGALTDLFLTHSLRNLEAKQCISSIDTDGQ
jgi:hypothetical protein